LVERMTSNAGYHCGIHWVAVFATVLTLPLLYVGGSVTTYRVGLAVPDWPSTFGENLFLYDFRNAPLGVRMEHVHRLYGAAVGLATIVLTGWFALFEGRRWMKGLAVLALGLVVIQGVLGGTRVTQVSTFLAAVHGCMGQAFFGLMVALCVLTGRDWTRGAPRIADPDRLRTEAAVVLALVFAQIVLGSWLRHYGTRTALWSHGILAAALWTYVVYLVCRIERRRADVVSLIPSSRVLGLSASCQIILGLAALVYLLPFDGTPRPVTFYQGVVRTGHQTNAGMLLAASVVLSLRSYRHLTGSATTVGSRQEEREAGRAVAAALDWEAVA
jgi:cytochrome c oxidase assembly protein subunit 15